LKGKFVLCAFTNAKVLKENICQFCTLGSGLSRDGFFHVKANRSMQTYEK